MDLKDCFMLFTKKETLDDDNKPVSEHTWLLALNSCWSI